uniref:Pyrin domain-containing protein n=1 Tax=Amphiprion percula TaxID=161767 RepID=A0A3P8RY00_AMPPE
MRNYQRGGASSEEELLYGILDDLIDEEFKCFKRCLYNKFLKGFQPIPKSRLEKADRTDTVDQMFQSYCIYTIKVAVKALEEILRNDLVDNIPKSIKKPEGKSERDENWDIAETSRTKCKH